MPADPTPELTRRYDRDALAYRQLWAPVLRPAGRRLLREFAPRAVERALDVGAGVGSLFTDWKELCPSASVVGVDRSPGILALAPVAMPRVIADARGLPFPAASVDLVTLIFMLFHLPDPQSALLEARRVIRPGGAVGTLTWSTELASVAHTLWTDCLDAHGAPPPDPATAARHESVDTPEKMEALLRAAGFLTTRAWAGELACTLEIESLIELKTRMGSERMRFDGLTESSREACVAAARRGLATLAPSDFAARATIVYAVAN